MKPWDDPIVGLRGPDYGCQVLVDYFRSVSGVLRGSKHRLRTLLNPEFQTPSPVKQVLGGPLPGTSWSRLRLLDEQRLRAIRLRGVLPVLVPFV